MARTYKKSSKHPEELLLRPKPLCLGWLGPQRWAVEPCQLSALHHSEHDQCDHWQQTLLLPIGASSALQQAACAYRWRANVAVDHPE